MMGESRSIPEVAVRGTLDDLMGLYKGQVGNIYNFVLRRCVADMVLAEDLTQETFLAAARHFRSTAEIPREGWLYEVARRRLVDHWRSETREERKLRLFSGGRVDHQDPDPAEAVVSGHRVAAALGALPASQQAAFALHHLDGYSTREVAKVIGRSVKATESLLARAKLNLASNYREQDYD
jgi:RNA polymerase sigma-70 factor (ECF subfamily)